MKIIYLIHKPFDLRDAIRFGCCSLSQKGHQVKLWNALALVGINSSKIEASEFGSNNLCEVFFEKKTQLKKAIKHELSNAIVIALLPVMFQTVCVYRLLNYFKVNYCHLILTEIPKPTIPLWVQVRCLSLRKIMNLIYFKCNILRSIDRPRFVMSVESVSNAPCIQGHALDYDIYLDLLSTKSNQHITGHYALFLDSGESDYFHPDFSIQQQNAVVSSENYFRDLISYMEYFETTYKMPIVIAAHPRVKYGKHLSFGNRKVIEGRTASLVRNSSVVLAHYSTAINFAVLYWKPIVFIQFNKYYRACINKYYPQLFADFLNASCRVTMGCPESYPCHIDKLMCVDRSKYIAYKDRYIKKQGTPEINNWTILNDFIQNFS